MQCVSINTYARFPIHAVLMSEVVGHFFPEKVDLHNYSKSNSVHKKEYNWMTLNQKVFSKMGFTISKSDIKDVVTCVKGTVEQVLYQIQVKMASYQQRKKRAQDNKTAVSPNYAHNDNSSSNNNNSNSNTEPYFSPSHKQSPLYRVEDNDFNNAHSNNSNQNLNNGNREVKNKKVHNIAKRERLGHKKSPAGRVRKGRQPSLSPSRGAKSQLKGKLGASAGVGKHA